MGPNQSKGAGAGKSANTDVAVKTSYYELLGVDRQASEDECVNDLTDLKGRSY
jgi:hypothetical protein